MKSIDMEDLNFNVWDDELNLQEIFNVATGDTKTSRLSQSFSRSRHKHSLGNAKKYICTSLPVYILRQRVEKCRVM